MIAVLNYFLMINVVIYVIVLLIFCVGLFFPNRKRQKKQYQVSVIIAARNEEKNISNILTDLVHQTYPRKKYEVILVDDHSTDGTFEIGQKFAKEYDHIKILRATHDPSTNLTAKKKAVAYGIRNSRGEIILTTDADCRVPPEWIETMISYFVDDVGMVVGFSQLRQSVAKPSLFEQWQAIDFLALLSAAQGSLNIGYPLAATGQNLAYRRAAFDEVGGFSEISHRVSGDDVLLLQLIHQKTNWRICFAPSTKAFNYSFPERTMRGFINQRRRWASNGSYQLKLNKGFFLIVSNTYLVNLLLLCYFPILFLLSKPLITGVVGLILKFITEFLLIWKGATVYNRRDLIKYFPLWAILQIPYVTLIGMWGNIGKFVWKSRRQ